MPYTATQLNAYYTSLTGTAPAGADAVLISAYATQSANGTLSDTNTLLGVFNSAGVQATFEVAESTYQFFTGSGVSQAGLNFLEGNAGSGNANGLNTAYYTQFNTENRYYNFAINLATTGGQGNAGFVSTYGALSFAQTVSAAYETIVGSANVGTAAANAAIADITSRQSFFTAVAQQRAGGVDIGGAAGQNIALKAIVVGYILEEANKADVGTYAKAVDQLEAAVSASATGSQITSPFGSNILTTFGSNGTGFNTGFNALGANTSSQTNFSLTTGVDTFQPNSGGIQFVGVVNNTAAGTGGATGDPTTLQAGDQVRGTGANNTLTIDSLGGGDVTGGAIISGIQTINVRNADGSPNAAVAGPPAVAATPILTLAATSVPGATQINMYLGTGNLRVTGLTAATAIGIVGNGSSAGGTLTGAFGTSAGTAVVNIAGGTLATDNVTLTGTGITGVNLNSNGALNSLGTVNLAASVTTLNLASTSPLTVTTTTAPGLTTLTAVGSGAVSLGATDIGGGAAGTGTVTSVNTTGLTSTGALTASFFTSAAAENFSLGAGSDNLTLDGNLATGTTVNLGAGANSVRVNGAVVAGTSIIGGASTDIITINGNVGAGASINAGGGGDTINLDGTVTGAAATAAAQTVINGGGNATLVTNAATLQAIDAFTAAQRANITGFSTVGVYNALTGGATYDVNALGAQNFASVGATAASTVAVNTGAIVTFIGNLGNGVGGAGGTLANNTATVTINEASVAQGATANTLTVGYTNQFPLGAVGAAATATVASTLVTNGVQTLSFVGNELTRGNGTATTAGTTGTTVRLALTDTAATSISFSGDDAFSFTPVATAAAGAVAATGFSALKTINGASSTGDLSINVATLISTLNAPVTVTTGSGNDTVTVRDFDRVITGGASAVSAVAVGFNTINVGVTTSGQTYSSVLDAKATDHITFGNVAAGGAFTTTATSVNATKIVLQATAGFQDYLDAASATAVANGTVSGFDFAGNTYLVENNNAANTFQNGVDSVIQLVGIHTFTAGTAAAGGVGTVILSS